MEVSELLRTVKETDEKMFDAVGRYREEIRDFDARLIEIEKERKRQYRGEPASEAGPETKAVSQFLRGMETKAIASLSTTDDGQGVVVRGDWSDRIFKRIIETSPVRQVANVMMTTTDALEVLVDRGEPASGWVAEKGDRDPTAASFMTRHRIEVFEHYSYPSVTQHMLEDSGFDVANWLENKLATRFGRQEAAAFIAGDGNGKPKGILTYDLVPDAAFDWADSPEYGDPSEYEIGAIYSGEDGDVTPDALFDTVDALKSDYLPGAAWMMSRRTRNRLRKLQDEDNRPYFQLSMSDSIPDRLLGFPVYLAEDLPNPEADSKSIWFGNWREGYTIVDRVGMTIQRDSLTRPGWAKFYARRRTGGMVTNPEALKCLVLGDEPSV
ncbi:MAG: phage major capsid protein [Chromatiales bacterium]|nr:phage major capsid protein [Chromatiales bacterium]